MGPGSVAPAIGVIGWMTLLTVPVVAQDPFVRLQGRQFTLYGQPFYPQVMNYGVELCGVENGSLDTSTFFLSAEGGYDRDVNSLFECHNEAECDTQLLRHFAKIKAMGFNTIRAVGAFGAVNRRDDNGIRHYTANVRLTNDYGPTYLAPMDHPTFTGPVAMKFFGLVRHLLDLCDSADLKVILLTGGRVGHMPPSDPPWLLYNSADAAAYTPFLARLAEELADHPALMAFDLWNEPRWGEDGTHELDKQTVCEWTTNWYDALHAHAPDHLVTLGGSPLAELRSWDPMAMKLDFYSPHMYPEPEPYGNYDLEIAYDAFKAWAQWQTRVTPMPWIVGETGFSADDDTSDHSGNPDYVCLLPGELFHRMPWMGGSEDDQVRFAFESMDAVRNAGGSGYSWWDFQSKRNSPVLYHDTLKKPLEVAGNWLAILGYSNGAGSCWREKKLADTIASYQLPPAPTVLPQKRWNYHEWLQDTLMESQIFKYGWIKDWQGRPIENALFEVGWKYEPIQAWDTLLHPVDVSWAHEVTNELGRFDVKIAPCDNTGQYHGWGIPHYQSSSIAVPGGSGAGGISSWVPGQTHFFYRTNLQMTDTVMQSVIGPWQEYMDSAFCDLVVGDQVVQGLGTYGGTVDYCARYSVHVPGEFHVQPGAKAHLYTKPVRLDDCALIPWHASIPRVDATAAASAREQVHHPSSLQLKFNTAGESLQILPNPASNEVLVIAEPRGGLLSIVDAAGRQVNSALTLTEPTTLNVTNFPSGTYTVHYTTRTWTSHTTLVVQH